MGKDLISRDALERIIKRAAELQAGEREIGEGLTTSEVLALGKDVGIPDRYLRQAMLEEQTRTAPEVATGTWAWLTGPRSIVAHRVVPGVGLTIGGALIARTYRGANERMQIALEQVLDRLERGETRATPSLPGQHPLFRIADEVRKVFENPRPKTRG